jgi:ABC-type transport system substrate-binding protein
MHRVSPTRTGIGRVVIVVIVVIILIIAVAGVYLGTRSTTSVPSSSSSSSSSSSLSATSVASSSSSSSSSSSTSSSTSNNSSSSVGGTITTLAVDDWGWPPDGVNILGNPFLANYPNWLAFTVYQPLVSIDGNAMWTNGSIIPEPALAANWTEAANGTTWTFNLQQGVKFSNGDPFNSYQVWGGFYGEYYLTGNASGWAGPGYTIFNMNTADFGPATIALMTQSGLANPNAQLMSIMSNESWPIYVNGPYQLIFNLRAPFQYFLTSWVQWTGLTFDTQYILSNGGFGTPAAINPAFNSAPVPGTGPYTVTNVVMNSQVSFTQNPNYWDKNISAQQLLVNPYLDPGHVQNVVATVKLDDVTRYVDLSSGVVQLAPILSQDWPKIYNDPSQYSYQTMPEGGRVSADIIGLALNVLRYPTNITSFRQAIAHAVNYSAIYSEALLGSQGGGAYPMMGPEYPAFTQLYDLGNQTPYQTNITLAKQELSQSGVNLATLQPLQFRYIQGCGVCQAVSTIVQSDLSNIGIPVNVIVTPPSQYAAPYVGGTASFPVEVNESQTTAQISWFGTATWAPDQPTPDDSLLVWISNQTTGGNWAIYTTPTAQKCVNDLTDGASQSQLISDCTAMQAEITQQVPYVWIGSLKLMLGSGTIVWNNHIIKSLLPDADFDGESDTAVFNTVQFVNGQDG